MKKQKATAATVAAVLVGAVGGVILYDGHNGDANGQPATNWYGPVEVTFERTLTITPNEPGLFPLGWYGRGSEVAIEIENSGPADLVEVWVEGRAHARGSWHQIVYPAQWYNWRWFAERITHVTQGAEVNGLDAGESVLVMLDPGPLDALRVCVSVTAESTVTVRGTATQQVK